jgi:hypothetical protein
VKIAFSYADAILASSKQFIDRLARRFLIYTLCNTLSLVGDC